MIFTASKIFIHERELPFYNEMAAAAEKMKEAINVVSDHCRDNDIEIDRETDLNGTGLIGPEFTGITSTLGHLEAKRTSSNPDMAAMIVKLLYEAGIQKGDYVAIGSSASFPALMIASLSAVEAAGAIPVTIISLGASSYGATRVNFNLLHIYDLLLERGIFSDAPAAVTLGGDNDTGEDFDTKVKDDLHQQIRESGLPFIIEEDLAKNVSERMNVYTGLAGSGRSRAFINIGGSYANMGTNQLVLNVKPGLNGEITLPPEAERGVLFEMASRNIPVIHLLYIKGLASNHGIAWDPVPFPESGISPVYFEEIYRNLSFILTASGFFIMMSVIVFTYKYKK
ncbi:MAG: poly-gamma-glutamate system protein [bacterium]|nr:poly-gamma-glutamate system protein [bacterium]